MIKNTTFLIVIALLSTACTEEAAPRRELSPIDVSFLIPLGELDDFGAQTTGGHGQLLPRRFFDGLDALTRTDEPDVLYENLNVVGVRLDPCFVEGLTAEVCQSQIRLVLQPVIGDALSLTARDAAVHAFYTVPMNELAMLSQELAALRGEEAANQQAGIHSMPGKAAALVMQSLGEQRLNKISFVSLHASEQAWTFGSFDVVNGRLIKVDLVGVPENAQHLTSVGGTEALDATILPPAVIEVDASRYMENIKRNEMTDPEIESARRGLERLLDPQIHDTGTVDCASCHMATASAYYANGDENAVIPEVYANTQNQRMFGFFGTDQSVSPRVHAETSTVLEHFKELH